MKRLLVSSRDRRTLIFGALAVLGILGVGRLRGRLRERLDYERAEAESVTRQLASDRALLANGTALRRVADAESGRLVSGIEGLLSAATPTAGAASLAALVERSAASEKVRMASTLTQGDTLFTGGFARVVVRAYATADVQGLARWLARLEGDDRLLAIRELTVTQPEPAADSRTPESLRVELVVEALVRARKTGGDH